MDNSIVIPVLKAQTLWFNSQGHGSWPPRKPGGDNTGPILVKTGRLKKSITGPSAILQRLPNGFIFGTTVEYALYHQAGTGHLPKRPPLIPAMQLDDTLERAVDNRLREIVNG